jgi:hypothetical protein
MTDEDGGLARRERDRSSVRAVTVEADEWMPFRRAVAECKLGRRPIEDMPTAALAALVAGLDGLALAQLAGMQGASWSEIEPVLDRAVSDMGGPLTEQDAKVLVADGWLARIADGTVDPGADADYALAEEVLWDLGGDYDWFRHAIYDLELLDAMQDDPRRERALIEMRQRAAQVLRLPVSERLADRARTLDERPFTKRRPAHGPKLLKWGRRRD